MGAIAVIAGIVIGVLLVGPWAGAVMGGGIALLLIGLRLAGVRSRGVAAAGSLALIAGVLVVAIGAARSLNPDPVESRHLTTPVVTNDSVTTTAGRAYPAGLVRRFFAGSLNRRLWEIPVRLPLLNLETAGGGLSPVRITGGEQTVGLRLLGFDSMGYDFRPIVKYPVPILPRWMWRSAVAAALDDQMAAQFPFGAVVVARLLDAAGIAAPTPVPVVMPDDPRLGPYRARFAGRVGLFAVHADERPVNQPGFAGYTRIVDSDTMYADLRRNPESSFDDQYYLRIRLIDMLVGDWDRHSGQWRWARDGNRWRAIPEDRDWAFARMNGVVGALAPLAYTQYVGFSPQLPPVKRLALQADHIDHRVLNRLDRQDFLAAARVVRFALTDSVIAAAVAALPPPYLALERERLVVALKARRDHLEEYSTEYYRYLARRLHLYGFATSADVVEFDQVSDSGGRVRLRSGGPNGPLRFERFVDARDTRELVLHIDKDQDRVLGNRDLPFKVSIEAGPRPGE
ncbi:MAG TPA: hypothetical protein VGP80_15080 [Gemmatimonadales bacterium]|nr:hypothetical protein [Gemmatimonadales bacterium]